MTEAPVVPVLVLFLLVGVLAWVATDSRIPELLVIENPTAEPRSVDVVWMRPGGRVSGSLLRVIQPAGSVNHPIGDGTDVCVRWIDPAAGAVKAAWPVPAGMTARTVVLRAPANPPVTHLECVPELVRHRIRPRLGRWIRPGRPDRVYRESLIARLLHRRSGRGHDSRR